MKRLSSNRRNIDYVFLSEYTGHLYKRLKYSVFLLVEPVLSVRRLRLPPTKGPSLQLAGTNGLRHGMQRFTYYILLL